MSRTNSVNNIPKRLNKRLNQRFDGPNCWNATMAYFEPKTKIEFCPGLKMDQWLSAKTIPVKNGQERPGDILVMRYPSGFGGYWCDDGTDLVHTAVLIERNGRGRKMFHKRGFTGKYLIESMTLVTAAYLGVTEVMEWRRYVGSKSQKKAA